MPNRINENIRGLREVRLVGDNVEQGIYSYTEAMRIADELNLDLVEISASANHLYAEYLTTKNISINRKREKKKTKPSQ